VTLAILARFSASTAPLTAVNKSARSRRQPCPATPAAFLHPVTHTHPSRQSDWGGRFDPTSPNLTPAKSPLSAQHRWCPTSRDLVPWRFSDAGPPSRRGLVTAGVRKPAQQPTFTGLPPKPPPSSCCVAEAGRAAHEPEALRQGVSRDIIEIIEHRLDTDGLDPADAIVIERMCTIERGGCARYPPVSPRVGNVNKSDPSLIEPVIHGFPATIVTA
jgi:hypothetical protein